MIADLLPAHPRERQVVRRPFAMYFAFAPVLIVLRHRDQAVRDRRRADRRGGVHHSCISWPGNVTPLSGAVRQGETFVGFAAIPSSPDHHTSSPLASFSTVSSSMNANGEHS